MAVKKTAATFGLAVETRANVAGIVINGFVPFSEFGEEVAGAKYTQPVKARSAATTDNPNGEILKDADGNTLYEMEDGSHTATPFQADGRTLRGYKMPASGKGWQVRGDKPANETAKADHKQATPKMTVGKRITDASAIWPDGKIRTLAIDLKANAPQTPEEFEASRTAATTTRKSKLLSDMSYDELMEAARAKKEELDAKK